jgi:hypothetical protein
MGEKSTQFGENCGRACGPPIIEEDLREEDGAYRHARRMAQRVVSLEQVDAKTKEAAIDVLTRRGRFGSWLLKLYRGETVKIHLHFYIRLCRMLEEQIAAHEERLAHEQAMLTAIRGMYAADRSAPAAGGARGDARLHAA